MVPAVSRWVNSLDGLVELVRVARAGPGLPLPAGQTARVFVRLTVCRPYRPRTTGQGRAADSLHPGALLLRPCVRERRGPERAGVELGGGHGRAKRAAGHWVRWRAAPTGVSAFTAPRSRPAGACRGRRRSHASSASESILAMIQAGSPRPRPSILITPEVRVLHSYVRNPDVQGCSPGEGLRVESDALR